MYNAYTNPAQRHDTADSQTNVPRIDADSAWFGRQQAAVTAAGRGVTSVNGSVSNVAGSRRE